MKTFPELYKLTSTGAVQVWTIAVEDNVIIVQHGQKDGKIQRSEEVIKEGKNIGRSNETTPSEQALAEATSKWEGKIKKGYVEDISRAAAGEKDIKGGYDCMLAHKFADHGHKISYPAYIQPKLNGHRCLAIVDNGVATLWSRTRKRITSCPHIERELEVMFPVGYHKVDGELYNHTYKDKFEELASLIRQEVPANNHTEVQYHMYDYFDHQNFCDRFIDLAHRYTEFKQKKYLLLTETVLVDNEEEMMTNFESFLSQGYEGAMARNADSKYIGRRSYDLQKVKEFQDAEFPIVGIKEGRGAYAECGIFVCKIPLMGHTAKCTCGDCTFDVKMRGSKERLKEFLANPGLWQDKSLVVKYQYISKYNVPIFPVGERLKDE